MEPKVTLVVGPSGEEKIKFILSRAEGHTLIVSLSESPLAFRTLYDEPMGQKFFINPELKLPQIKKMPTFEIVDYDSFEKKIKTSKRIDSIFITDITKNYDDEAGLELHLLWLARLSIKKKCQIFVEITTSSPEESMAMGFDLVHLGLQGEDCVCLASGTTPNFPMYVIRPGAVTQRFGRSNSVRKAVLPLNKVNPAPSTDFRGK